MSSQHLPPTFRFAMADASRPPMTPYCPAAEPASVRARSASATSVMSPRRRASSGATSLTWIS
jgi:hypothetical protein